MSRTSRRNVPQRVRTAAGLAGRVLTALVTAALLAGIGLGAWLGTPWLEARAAERHPGTDRPTLNVTFNWPPLGAADDGSRRAGTWLPVEDQRALVGLVREHVGNDPARFRPDALERAGRALLATGWFETIRAVSREPAGGVRVDAVWRVPVALVRRGSVDYLVSADGRLLPKEYRADACPLPVVIGASQPAPTDAAGGPAHGQVWAGADTGAGLALLRLLATRPYRAQVRGVDVSDYNANRRLVILTDRGTRIVWGGAPDELVPGEQPPAAKLRRLDWLASRFGHIDGGERTLEINTQFVQYVNAPTPETSTP